MHAPVVLVHRAGAKDGFGSALRDQDQLSSSLDDNRETPALEVAWDLVGFRVLVDSAYTTGEDGGVQGTLHACLKRAVHGTQEQRAVRVSSERIDRSFERQHAGRQRARLVAALHIDTAEVLDRRQVLERPGKQRLERYKELLTLYNERSTAAHAASDVETTPLVQTFVHMRNALVRMIDEGKVPTQADLEALLFCVEPAGDNEADSSDNT